MRNIFIILSVLVSLPYAGNQMAKLKMACDIGNETACKKLIELKSNSGSNTKKSYQSVSKETYKDPFLAKVCNMDSLSWRDLNVHKYQLQSLRKLGVDSPEEAKKWICAGAYGNGAGFDWDIAKWQRNGIKTADEFIAYKQAKSNDRIRNNNDTLDFSSKKRSHSDSYDNMVCDRSITKKFPNILKQHSSANWLEIKGSFERNGWKRTGVTPQDAFRWKDMWFGSGDIDRLKALGIYTPAKAKIWVCSGMHHSEKNIVGGVDAFFVNVSTAKNNNISPNEAFTWYKIGLLPPEIVKWKKLGVKTPKSAKEWIDLGVIHSQQLKRWVKAEIKDPDTVKQWMQIIKVSNTQEIRNNAINNCDSMQGDYLHAIWFWYQLKIYNPEEVKKWMKLKLGTNEVRTWQHGGVRTPEEAKKWIDVGLSQGYKWKKAGFKAPEEALLWIDAGITDGYLFNPNKNSIEEVIQYKKCMLAPENMLNEAIRLYNGEKFNYVANKCYQRMEVCRDELDKKYVK